jgi:amino acid permease
MAKAVQDDPTYGTMADDEENGSTSKGENASTQSPDVEDAFVAPLHRRLRSRHLTMIAIGGMCSISGFA